MSRPTAQARRRRGLNLVEMLVALAISSALLTATLVALQASFIAYQATTEQASTHTVSRLVLDRMLTLIRTGDEFGPYPVNPLDNVLKSNFIEFMTQDDQLVTIQWDPVDENLVLVVDNGSGPSTSHVLLEGVEQRTGTDGLPVSPFTLEYENGRNLYRITIDLTVVADDQVDLDIEGDMPTEIRLVASAMPRSATY